MKMQFQAGVEYKGKVFFSELNGEGLFSYDLDSGTIDFCRLFCEVDCPLLHRKAFLYGNGAWFIPQRGETITFVDLEDNSIEHYAITYNEVKKNSCREKYRDGIIINDLLICAPFDIDTVAIIDLKNHEIRYKNLFIDPNAESIVAVDKRGDEAVFFPLRGERVIFYNTKNDEIRYEKRQDKYGDHSEVAIWGERTIYAPWNKHELLIADVNGINKTIKTEETETFFSGHVVFDERLLFLPFRHRRFLIVHLDNYSREVGYIDYMSGKFSSPMMQIASSDKLLFSDKLNSSIVEINPRDCSIVCHELNYEDKNLLMKIGNKMLFEDYGRFCNAGNSEIMSEKGIIHSLRVFIKLIERL